MKKGTRNTGGGMSPKENLPTHFVHHKSDMDCHASDFETLEWEVGH